jgi:hypothetical protein
MKKSEDSSEVTESMSGACAVELSAVPRAFSCSTHADPRWLCRVRLQAERQADHSIIIASPSSRAARAPSIELGSFAKDRYLRGC